MSEQLVTKVRQIEMLLVSRIVLFTILAVSLILFFLFNLVSVPQNDFMYGVAAAVWAQHGKLYTDVPFIQAPLSIILSLLFTKITGNVDVYLFARVTSESCWCWRPWCCRCLARRRIKISPFGQYTSLFASPIHISTQTAEKFQIMQFLCFVYPRRLRSSARTAPPYGADSLQARQSGCLYRQSCTLPCYARAFFLCFCLAMNVHDI